MSNYVSLNKAVAVESEMVGSQGDVKVTVSYESRKSFRLVMDGLRFAKFARLARKQGIPVNGINGAVGPYTAKKQRAGDYDGDIVQLSLFDDNGRPRVVVVNHQDNRSHPVRIFFNTRQQAARVNWEYPDVSKVNGIILDNEVIVEPARKRAILGLLAQRIVSSKVELTVRGNQVSFTL